MRWSWWWLVAILLAGAWLSAADDAPKAVPVEEFDREEVQRYFQIAVKAQEAMERHIEMTARRMGLEVERYNYDVERGVFVPKVNHEEETVPAGVPAGE